MTFTCSELAVMFVNGRAVVPALDGVSFESGHGEFLSLIGPSGCGKTTLLRAIAGILPPSRGTINFTPEVPAEQGERLMVYQEDSLFPWMNVLENAAFGLEMKGISVAERTRAARELLCQYGLNGREYAWPHQISAGMKQRVAVIRAFLSDPALLLMDEPFGALDSPTRLALQTDLLELWAKNGKSVIFVTHDVDEAIYLSDRILVMSPAPGRIVAEFGVNLSRHDRREAMLSGEFLSLKRQVLEKLSFVGEVANAAEAVHAA